MEIKKEKIEVDTVVVSEDGVYRRYIKNLGEEDKAAAIEDVRKYEGSAKGVIFARLRERGILSPRLQYVPRNYSGKDGDSITEEQKKADTCLRLLDTVLDNGYERSSYYLFTPKCEQDIKDMAVFNKMALGNDLLFTEPDSDSALGTNHPEINKVYIYMSNPDAEWGALISPDLLSKRISKMSSYFEAAGKTQMKTAK